MEPMSHRFHHWALEFQVAGDFMGVIQRQHPQMGRQTFGSFHQVVVEHQRQVQLIAIKVGRYLQ